MWVSLQVSEQEKHLFFLPLHLGSRCFCTWNLLPPNPMFSSLQIQTLPITQGAIIIFSSPTPFTITSMVSQRELIPTSSELPSSLICTSFKTLTTFYLASLISFNVLSSLLEKTSYFLLLNQTLRIFFGGEFLPDSSCSPCGTSESEIPRPLTACGLSTETHLCFTTICVPLPDWTPGKQLVKYVNSFCTQIQVISTLNSLS